MSTYELHKSEHGVIKSWTRGVPVDVGARQQLENTASLPIIHGWVAAMPDVHRGYGATVGSVIPTLGAVIPAAVGVDIGCGMMAMQTSLTANHLPDNLRAVRTGIERAVPHGKSGNGGRRRDTGAWHDLPESVIRGWKRGLGKRFEAICHAHPEIEKSNHVNHLGTLGTGNHFVEVCLDGSDRVWVMLHSGSRGVGNRIGSYFIKLARRDMLAHLANLPDRDLAYFSEGTEHFAEYVEAVGWAQDFARFNRELMMDAALRSLRTTVGPFSTGSTAVNCHHNYVQKEHHYGADVWLTRKGAVRAREGELGIIPGSMGAKSFIVRGLGNPESFHSCSHGAGRLMSRTAAKEQYTVADQVRATEGVECRKDAGVIDEIPMAYKDIDAVMAAQADLVEIVHTLKQVVCVKG